MRMRVGFVGMRGSSATKNYEQLASFLWTPRTQGKFTHEWMNEWKKLMSWLTGRFRHGKMTWYVKHELKFEITVHRSDSLCCIWSRRTKTNTYWTFYYTRYWILNTVIQHTMDDDDTEESAIDDFLHVSQTYNRLFSMEWNELWWALSITTWTYSTPLTIYI